MSGQYLYLLHWNSPEIRAHHYCGVSSKLRARLAAHAAGRGSCLTRHLHRIGVKFELAAVWRVTESRKYEVERHLKRQHNLERYCPLCACDQTSNPFHAQPIDPANINYDRSQLIEGDVKVVFSHERDLDAISAFTKRLMHEERSALGFIPAGGEQGLSYLIRHGMVAQAYVGKNRAGYCAFTRSKANETIKIQQVCVADEFRFAGCGTALINAVASMHPSHLMQCNVADDLPANHFWTQIRFTLQHQYAHATSKRKLNHYEKETPP